MKKQLLSIILALVLMVNLLPMTVLAEDHIEDDREWIDCPVPGCDGYCGADHDPSEYPLVDTNAPGTSTDDSEQPKLTWAQWFKQNYSAASNGTAADGSTFMVYGRTGGGRLMDLWGADGSKTSLTTDGLGNPTRLGYISPQLTMQLNYRNGTFLNGTAIASGSGMTADVDKLDDGLWLSTLRGGQGSYISVGTGFGSMSEVFGLEYTEVENEDGTITQIVTSNGKEVFRRTLDKDGNTIYERTANGNEVEETTVTENPDGSTTTTTTYADGGTRVETRYKNGVTVTVSTYSDGTVVTETVEKDKTTIMTEYPKGSDEYEAGILTEITETHEDGTTVYTIIDEYNHKTVTTEYPDGTTVVEHSNGTKITTTPTEGGGETTVTEAPNGFVATKECRPDGTMTVTNEWPNGDKQVIEHDEDGNEISNTTVSAEAGKQLTDAAQNNQADNVTIDVSGGGSTSTTVENADGSTTTTVTYSSSTEIKTTYPDGSVTVYDTYDAPNGSSHKSIISEDAEGKGATLLVEYGKEGITRVRYLAYQSASDVITDLVITPSSGTSGSFAYVATNYDTFEEIVTYTYEVKDGTLYINNTAQETIPEDLRNALPESVLSQIDGYTADEEDSLWDMLGEYDTPGGQTGADGTTPGTATVNVPVTMAENLASRDTSLTILTDGGMTTFSPGELGKISGTGNVSFIVNTAADGTMSSKVTSNGQAVDAAGVQATLVPVQNRLDHLISNLDSTAENIQAAQSTVRDTDIAKEMTAFVKNNILTQAAQSMLAQANQMPQSVLQLLQ